MHGSFMQDFNYHTHTSRCGHAEEGYADEEYVQDAIRAGLREVAFTEHMPYATGIPFKRNQRMPIELVEDYLQSINGLEKKYKDRINIKTGFEVEYLPSMLEHLSDLKGKTDMLILGQHVIERENGEIIEFYSHYAKERDMPDKDLEIYVESIEKAIKSGLVKIIAHPDLFMRFRKEFGDKEREASRRICKIASEYGIPLEINLNYIWGNSVKPSRDIPYPAKEFWQIAGEYEVKALYGADAHYRGQIMDMEKNANKANEIIGSDTISKLNFETRANMQEREVTEVMRGDNSIKAKKVLDKLANYRKRYEYAMQIAKEQYGEENIVSVKYLSSGHVNNTFLVELKNCEEKKVVVRVRYCGENYMGKSRDNEEMIGEILGDSINYPRTFIRDNSHNKLPVDYSIEKFVQGRNLRVGDSADIYRKLGQILRKVHMAPVPATYLEQFIGENGEDTIDEYYRGKFQRAIERVEDREVAEKVKSAQKYYYEGRYQMSDISLTHHDLTEKNIMVNSGEPTLLDWDAARVEASEVDFIKLKYYVLSHTTKDNVRAFMEGYGPIKLSDNFFIQEIMWLARYIDLTKNKPSRGDEIKLTPEYLKRALNKLMFEYRGPGTYCNLEQVFANCGR